MSTVNRLLAGNPLRQGDAVVLLIAAALGLVWFATHPIIWTWDSETYFENALAFLGKTNQGVWYMRGPGLPALLILSLAPVLNVLWPFATLQTAMGVAVTWMFYRTLAFASPRAALIVTFVLLSSFLPFLYSKAVMSEQAFLFFMAMVLFSAARLLYVGGAWAGVLLAFGLTGMALTRANGPYFAFLVVPLLLLGARGARRHVLLGLVLFGVVAGGATVWKAKQPARHIWATQISQTGGGITDTTGKFLFYVLYTTDVRMKDHNPPFVTPANGPKTKELFDTVRAYFETRPDAFKKNIDIPTFGKYAGNVDKLMSNLVSKPNNPEYWMMWSVADVMRGPSAADRLFFDAWLETVRTRPLESFLIYLENLRQCLFAQRSMAMPLLPSDAPVTQGVYVRPFKGEILKSGSSTAPSGFDAVLDKWFRLLQGAVVVLALVTAPWALLDERRVRWLWMIAAAISAGIYVSVVIGSIAEFRYVFYGLMTTLAASTLGGLSLMKRFTKQKQLSSGPMSRRAEEGARR